MNNARLKPGFKPIPCDLKQKQYHLFSSWIFVAGIKNPSEKMVGNPALACPREAGAGRS
jgi:hypothetical protein